MVALTDGGDCMTASGWTFHTDHTQTVAINDDEDYLLLALDIGGFHGDRTRGHNQQIAQLSFEFETQCLADCQLALLRVLKQHSLYS